MNIKMTGKALCVLLLVFPLLYLAQEYKSKLTVQFDSVELNNGITNKLHIEEAVAAALLMSPELKALILEIEAMDRAVNKERRNPNPVLNFEIENILGGGEFSGFKGGEITAVITQEVLLAGKISKRSKIADLQKEAVYYHYEKKRLDLITEVRILYNRILSLKQQISKEKALIKNAEELSEFISKLKDRGHASESDLLRAKLTYKQLKLETSSTQNELESEIEQLIQLTGISDLHNYEFEKSDFSKTGLPDYEKIEQLLEYNPSLVKYNVIDKLADENISYQEAHAIPDLTIAAGIRRINEVSENAFVLGVSIPLPLFDSNLEGIDEAIIRKKQYKVNYEAEKLSLKRGLKSHYINLVKFDLIMKTINDDLLTDAKNAYEITKQGFKSGRYSLHEVLESQRTILELELKHCEAKREFNNTIFEIEKIIGQSIFSPDDKELN